MKPEVVAIVGSRQHPHLSMVREYVRTLPADTVVVSGGAGGVDVVAVAEARRLGFRVIVHLPDNAQYGFVDAPKHRNKLIAFDCDRMVAFPYGKARGTGHAILCAVKLGKPVDVRRCA
jgi:predicted Rossmann-fold nucleotide-binding protein